MPVGMAPGFPVAPFLMTRIKTVLVKFDQRSFQAEEAEAKQAIALATLRVAQPDCYRERTTSSVPLASTTVTRAPAAGLLPSAVLASHWVSPSRTLPCPLTKASTT